LGRNPATEKKKEEKMKKKMLLSVMALAMLFAFAQVAMAYTVTLTGGSGYGPYATGSGGEFTLIPSSDLEFVLNFYNADPNSQTKNVVVGSKNFQTFCLEAGETISAYGTYTALISNKAITGSAGPGGDPISIGTAYLYSQFAAGTLTGYDYTNPGRSGAANSADLLQKAIWFLEDESTGVETSFYALVAGLFADPKADAKGAYNVMALNLYTASGALAQDVLTVVPIPAAAWLLGSGLLGLVAIRRRRVKK
jgi:hypothetical protein